MVLGAKNLGVVCRGPENWHFMYPVAPASHVPLQTGLGTRQYRQAIATAACTTPLDMP